METIRMETLYYFNNQLAFYQFDELNFFCQLLHAVCSPGLSFGTVCQWTRVDEGKSSLYTSVNIPSDTSASSGFMKYIQRAILKSKLNSKPDYKPTKDDKIGQWITSSNQVDSPLILNMCQILLQTSRISLQWLLQFCSTRIVRSAPLTCSDWGIIVRSAPT